MKITQSRHASSILAAGTGVVALVLVGTVVVQGSNAAAAPTAVGLGTAGSFAVLAGSTITNTGPTTITGDIGLSPGTAFTGDTTVTTSGTIHTADAVALRAQNDLTTAYNTAAAAKPPTAISADLVGKTLKPGVYNSASSVALSGVLTLDAAGDPNAVWIFQAGSTLITASGSRVAMLNGAQACNVYWQVGSSATLGTGSTFKGTILALTSITLTTAAKVDGGVLARNGAVTMDTNTITRSACTTVTTAPTTRASSSATPSSSATRPSTPAPSTTRSATPSPSTAGNTTPSASPTGRVSATPRGPVGTGDNSSG
jgi:hypothetical protein